MRSELKNVNIRRANMSIKPHCLLQKWNCFPISLERMLEPIFPFAPYIFKTKFQYNICLFLKTLWKINIIIKMN